MQFVGSNCCLFTLISQYQLIDASHDRILRGMVNFLNFRMNISDISLSADWISHLKCVTHRRFEKKVPLLLGQTMRLFGPKIGILRPNLPRSQSGRHTRYDEFVLRGSMNYAFMTPRTGAMWKYVTHTFEQNAKAILAEEGIFWGAPTSMGPNLPPTPTSLPTKSNNDSFWVRIRIRGAHFSGPVPLVRSRHSKWEKSLQKKELSLFPRNPAFSVSIRRRLSPSNHRNTIFCLQ